MGPMKKVMKYRSTPFATIYRRPSATTVQILGPEYKPNRSAVTLPIQCPLAGYD